MNPRIMVLATLLTLSAFALAPFMGDVAPVGSAEAYHCDASGKNIVRCNVPNCIPGDLECGWHPELP